MPDITMCDHCSCPLRVTCKRHEDSGTKPRPIHQSWGSYSPRFVGTSDHEPDVPAAICDGYWPTKEKP